MVKFSEDKRTHKNLDLYHRTLRKYYININIQYHPEQRRENTFSINRKQANKTNGNKYLAIVDGKLDIEIIKRTTISGKVINNITSFLF